MPRKHRHDKPGLIQHVLNRGVGKRPIFELESDHRYFRMLLACAARAKRIRVFAFCQMSNHFHLLVESRDGALSETMRRVQSLYAARFNRTRDERRPGHLFGARFKSFPVTSQAYLHTLVRYFDLNPVGPGLCADPLAYRHGSAQFHGGRRRRPPWLSTHVVDRFLANLMRAGLDREGAYRQVFAVPDGAEAAYVVAARIEGAWAAGDDLDLMLGRGNAWRGAWLARQARAADGTRVAVPMASVGSILAVVGEQRARAPLRTLGAGRGQSRSLWDVLAAGLLRNLGGQSFASMGALLETSSTNAARRHAAHCSAMSAVPVYAVLAAETARAALVRCYGGEAERIARGVARRRMSQGGGESA
jgi:REP element-mobilizing transposase RayT